MVFMHQMMSYLVMSAMSWMILLMTASLMTDSRRWMAAVTAWRVRGSCSAPPSCEFALSSSAQAPDTCRK